jgi:arginine decarboxylase
MGFFDVGGGLAVDYDGSHTDNPSSSNYSLDEYAADVVEVVMAVVNGSEIPAPVIVTEAGRATVAHHSVLLFNVLDASCLKTNEPSAVMPDDAHELLLNLCEVEELLDDDPNLQECYHDAVHYRDELRRLFEYGEVSLRERAVADRLFWRILSRIVRLCRSLERVPEELQALDAAIVDVYHGNFSVFQSLPDAWAIGQIFPVVPIHRLNERPTRAGMLADITCDCDGRLDRFIGTPRDQATLPLHEMNGKDYYLGVFLVGAYQETLGDLHNLLGDTNVVGVQVDGDGHIEYEREIAGDTVADVLSYVEYEPRTMIERVRRTAERAVRESRITPEERREIMASYEDGLRGYTYFEH